MWAVKCNLTDILLREVVDWRVVICAVVDEVVRASIPEVAKLAFRVSAPKPFEFHVRGLLLPGIIFILDNPMVVELSY